MPENHASLLAEFLPFEPTTQYLIAVAFGTIAVAIFCFASFNMPADEYSTSEHERRFQPREQTGHIQYLLGFCVYLVTLTAAYLLLCAVGPKIGYDFLSLIPAFDIGDSDKDVIAANFPVYLALLLLGVIPGFDKLNVMERPFRAAIHRRASIPTALRTLAHRLRTEELRSDVHVEPGFLIQTSTSNAIDPSFVLLWNRLAFLFFRYTKRDSALLAYLSEQFEGIHQNIYTEITTEFNFLLRIVREHEKRLSNTDNASIDGELFKRTEDLYVRLCYFVAGSTIQKCGLSLRRWIKALNSIGYAEGLAPPGSSIGVLIAGFLALGTIAAIMIFAADEFRVLRSAIGKFEGTKIGPLQMLLYTLPFLLRQGTVVIMLFAMYSKTIVSKEDRREKEYERQRLGASLTIGMAVCLGGAVLAQVGYWAWVTGLQFEPSGLSR